MKYFNNLIETMIFLLYKELYNKQQYLNEVLKFFDVFDESLFDGIII